MSDIENFDIRTHITHSIVDVFDTMLSLKLEPADAATAEISAEIRNVESVSFSGDATGRISIHAGADFSREMAAKMLGRKVEEIEGDEEIRDMLGEIGNSVAGNLKSAFSNAGLMCTLSTPSFTSGNDFEIEALNMENYERFAFRCGENIIFVEMEIKVAGREQTQISVDPDETGTAEPEQPPVQAEENVHAETRNSKTPEDVDLDLLLDIPLEIKVELGRSRIKIRKLLNLTPGSAIKLIKLEGEPVDILVNETLIARGEVIVQNAKYGIRVTEITSRMDRLRSFSL